jgi:endo-1,4-beta-xylanase
MFKMKKTSFAFIVSAAVLVVCAISKADGQSATLKDAFKNDFMVGVALNESEFEGMDPRAVAIVTGQFNTISPENCLKWESVHPHPGVYDFSTADQYVAFGEANHMFIVGHNLIWHNQTPGWVFRGANGAPLTRDELIARMRDHIYTVVGRYKGKIGGWDVVNEALNEDGTLRDSNWRKIIGDDYLVYAYKFAHEADPGAQLYYNDYSLENKPKRDGAVALIKKLQAAGIPIYAVGLQGHYKMDWPANTDVDETIKTFSDLGIKVSITELDIDLLPQPSPSQTAEVTENFRYLAALNPYTNGLPDSAQQALTQRYVDLFKVFVANRANMERITFWGVTDAQSWLNDWPIRGRTSYPLLFNRDYQPKPAVQAIIETANNH